MRPMDEGWAWFQDAAPAADRGTADMADMARAFARLFSGRDGEAVLTHLRAMTGSRFLGPDASEAALRHLDGQRHLVAYIGALIERGRAGT